MPHTFTHGIFDFVPALRRSRLQSDLLEEKVKFTKTLEGSLEGIARNKRELEEDKQFFDQTLRLGLIDPEAATKAIRDHPRFSKKFPNAKLVKKVAAGNLLQTEENGKRKFFLLRGDGQGGADVSEVSGIEGDIVTKADKLPSLGTEFNRKARELFPDVAVEDLTGTQVGEVNRRVKSNRLEFEKAQGAGEQEAKNRSEFNRMALFTQEGVEGIDRIVTTLQKSPEAFGTSGALAATTIGLFDQVVNLGKLFAPNFSISKNIEDFLQDTRDLAVGAISDEDFFEKSTKPFAQHFRDVGIENRVIQSQLLGLATTIAAQEAIRGRGRLTQEAVRRQLERLGNQTQSPEAFSQVLLQVRQEMINRMQLQERIVLQGEIPTFGLPPTVTTPSDAQAEADRFLQGP